MKSKKILTILLSLAIMFTFMPAMAFANGTGTTDGTWNPSFTEVTVVKDGKTIVGKAVHDYDKDNARIKASVPASTDATVADLDNAAYFVDMTGAKLKLSKTKMYKTQFENLWKTVEGVKGELVDPVLTLTVPSDVRNYADLATADKTYEFKTANEWVVTVAVPKEYEPNATAEQEVTLKAVVSRKTAGTEAAADTSDLGVYGYTAPIEQKVTIIPDETQAVGSSVKFFKDKIDTTTAVMKNDEVALDGGADATVNVAFDYDGNAHKVVASEVKDVKVTWSVWNKTTNTWDSATECPSVTNAEDAAKVKAVVEWNTTTNPSAGTTQTVAHKSTVTLNLSVNATNAVDYSLVNAIYFNFNKDGNAGDFAYFVNEGDAYDVASYVVPEHAYWKYVAASESYSWLGWADAKKEAKAKATVSANNAILNDFFNEFYEVTETSTAADPQTKNLKIKSNLADKMAEINKTTAAKNAFTDKYGTMLKNFFGLTGADALDATKLAGVFKIGNGSASIYVKLASYDYEVEFTSAPSSKVIHVKKAKKLKKNKTFTVKAEAANGAAITYKLINANSKIKIDKNTGKITLKKGLAKGTYKIKVKAYVASASAAGVDASKCSETQAITIKIKK